MQPQDPNAQPPPNPDWSNAPVQPWPRRDGYGQGGPANSGYGQSPGWDPAGPQGAQQGYGYPTPAHPNYPPQNYAPVPPPPAGRGKSRKALWFALVGALVIAGLVVGLVLAFSGDDKSDAPSPQDTVTGYLTALSEGHAAQALSYGPEPASRVLLTDTVLGKQQKLAKISNIKIANEQVADDEARVEATYAFGNQSADETYDLTKTGGQWRLSRTVIQLRTDSVDDAPKPQLFGIDISSQSNVFVFPGPLDLSSGDPNFTITKRSVGSDKFALSPQDYPGSLYLQTALSSTGQQQVQAAVQTAMKACAQSHDIHPTDCPQSAYELDSSKGYPDDGAVTWGTPTDFSKIEYRVGYDTPTDISVSGTLNFPVKAKVSKYVAGKGEVPSVVTGTVEANLYGTVDLSSTPAKFSTD